ncbi:branched-chain amino acid ABC transporter permease [Candidatus Korarchaeum cryptofilum]|uniref:ABC-type branched-chain amino acid transport system, permease component n=1 Tax=Korarchaeum cryptofilum (strain OPF8) TaxID=374847 RepID=B1L6C0_KORCO|nr:branched-chain amino acid ABC transporter permease [Candidatus Korarchaeum cryptofilum]ACB07999.1 ABC-type branched-chain amino acid transport system, permease component [Candidatus Korarchaeum cryptofilum OPF8]
MLSTSLLVEQTLLGLMMGGIYAAIGVGLTMIFGVMKLSNFAHGEFYMLGAFLTYTLVSALGSDPYILAPLAAIAVGFLGIILNKLVFLSLYKELREAKGAAAFFFQDLRFIMLTIGLSILFVDLALVIWGPIPIAIPSVLTSHIIKLPGGFSFSLARIMTFIIALASLIILYMFLRVTKTGKAIRATAQNPSAAALVGIDTYRIYDVTMFISTALAALAGGILGPIYNVYPTMGLDVVAKAFVVVITGGMGNIIGSILAGFLIGLAEGLGGVFLGTEYRQVVAFVIMILVLWFRPQGILGGRRS